MSARPVVLAPRQLHELQQAADALARIEAS
jgi:hypothetical protein